MSEDLDIDGLAYKIRGPATMTIPHSWREQLKTPARGDEFDERYRGHLYRLPTVVCLCGSTRFHDEFQRANYELTMQGKIVLSVGFFVHGLSDEQLIKEMRKAGQKAREDGGDVGDDDYFKAVLLATRNAHSENVGCTPEQKEALDDLHLRKIDLSDEVRVLNKGGYIGSSTQRELAYAIMLDRRLSFLEPDEGKAYLSDHIRQDELREHITKFMEAKQ